MQNLICDISIKEIDIQLWDNYFIYSIIQFRYSAVISKILKQDDIINLDITAKYIDIVTIVSTRCTSMKPVMTSMCR